MFSHFHASSHLVIDGEGTPDKPSLLAPRTARAAEGEPDPQPRPGARVVGVTARPVAARGTGSGRRTGASDGRRTGRLREQLLMQAPGLVERQWGHPLAVAEHRRLEG